ncbi:MAG: hypothetical protein AAB554_01630 [Patescibacteria group bacterium]
MGKNPWGLIKSRTVKRALKRLAKKELIDLTDEGRHWKVELKNGMDSYPIPLSHREANLFIVKGLAEWLEKHKICSEEEFMRDAR